MTRPPEQRPSAPAAGGTAAVRLLQCAAVCVMVFPSDSVVPAIGASGFLASLVALALFAVYLSATALGLHPVLDRATPLRLVLGALWCVSLTSYALMQLEERPLVEVLSADRWLLLVAAVSGVVLVASEGLTSVAEVRRVTRALVWGGAFCGTVAALQFWVGLDLAAFLRAVPGFSVSEGYASIMSRGALSRVAGTALHPIELGVVAGMLLPLAVHLAIHDVERPVRRRWAAVALTASALPVSVSRSAVLALVVAVAVLLVLLPARQRLVGLVLLPFGLVAVFFTTPGLLTTLASFFAAGSSDPSVATRLDDYPMVQRLLLENPWFGRGGGAFFPADAFEILDNQYLKTVVELGVLGELALCAYLLAPVLLALSARRRTQDPELRMLAAALAAGSSAAVISPLTFDAFSFPMFTLAHALMVGLTGACWSVARRPAADRPDAPPHEDRGLVLVDDWRK